MPPTPETLSRLSNPMGPKPRPNAGEMHRGYRITPTGCGGNVAFHYQSEDEETFSGQAESVEACRAEIDERIAEWGWRGRSAPTLGLWMRAGLTIYALNSRGTNRWSALVQGGFDGNLEHTTEEELLEIARVTEAAPDLYEALNAIVRSGAALSSEQRIRANAALAKARGDQ